MKPPQTPEEISKEWAQCALWFALISAFLTAMFIMAVFLETQLRP